MVFLKLSTQSGALAVADYLRRRSGRKRQRTRISVRRDRGAARLTDCFRKGLASGGRRRKDANLYLVNRDRYGKIQSRGRQPSSRKSAIVSRTPYSLHPHTLTAPSTMVRSATRSRPSHSTTRTSRPPRQPRTTVLFYPAATPSISANGTNDAILWAVENGYSATLHAYDATDLSRRTLQQQSGPFCTRPGRPRQQIHHAYNRQWQVYVGTTYGVAVSACDS